MQNIKTLIPILMVFFLAGNLDAQQQTSKSKSADKLYEKGELNRNVTVRNTSYINSEYLDFSPAFYENGLVYVSSRHKSGPKDKNLGETFMEIFYAELMSDGMPTDPQGFSVQINSQVHEGPVTFSRSGDVMYFTRNNMTKGLTKTNSNNKIVMKIYQAHRGQFDWENVKELPFNSDEYTCFHPSLSAEGTKLYFASDMPGGFGGKDLYMVEKKADTWSQPINMGEEINTSANEGFPYIHPSGTLFFSSNGHGGYGGWDMFMVGLNDDNWNGVKNLGTPFNSATDDLGFIINDEGTRGYFASDREGGYGKDDIYVFEAARTIIESDKSGMLNSKIIAYDAATDEPVPGASVRIFERASDGFIEGDDLYDVQLLPGGEDGSLVMKLVRKSAEELGEPTVFTNDRGQVIQLLKSDRNYMILTSKKGYESSEIIYSTAGEEGPQTIRIPMKARTCATLMGIVSVEEYGNRVPNAIVTIVNECNGGENIIYSNSQGEFEFCLPFGCDFSITAEKEGYTKGLNKISTVSSTHEQEVEVNVKLNPIVDNIIKEPIKEGTVIVLENIYYDFDKSAIRKGDARELEGLIALMKQYPSMEVEMVAHTDSRGSEEYNLDLSLRRAESARKYLVYGGITEDRIKAFGYGESQPRNDCVNGTPCREEEHAYNRRTEVRVTKIDEPIKVQYQDGDPHKQGRMD